MKGKQTHPADTNHFALHVARQLVGRTTQIFFVIVTNIFVSPLQIFSVAAEQRFLSMFVARSTFLIDVSIFVAYLDKVR